MVEIKLEYSVKDGSYALILSQEYLQLSDELQCQIADILIDELQDYTEALR